MRASLESAYCSAHLHGWIDLVFGHKQTGRGAEEALNVFYYLTYAGRADAASASDPAERAELERQLDAHRLDLQYIRYFPPEHKYLSLYPTEGGENDFVQKRKRKLRELVAKRIAEGKGRTDADADSDAGDDDGDGERLEEDDFFLAEGGT
uniref:BEACH domain-containing protein n=1 Tax=Diacronema lutheri TaxID=2081491 RepID=A0A7R9UWL1_DIALT|mmetsp:Transcript_7089/g.22364  ORF Transcript_7089/g.22364 Transcript_7089/m.22364 type:complete len:151 (+) Transcript_7089:1-453(+)